MEVLIGHFVDGVDYLWIWGPLVMSLWLWIFPHFQLFSSYYLWLAFFYTMMKIIMSMYTTGTPKGGRDGGKCKGGCRNIIIIYNHIFLT